MEGWSGMGIYYLLRCVVPTLPPPAATLSVTSAGPGGSPAYLIQLDRGKHEAWPAFLLFEHHVFRDEIVLHTPVPPGSWVLVKVTPGALRTPSLFPGHISLDGSESWPGEARSASRWMDTLQSELPKHFQVGQLNSSWPSSALLERISVPRLFYPRWPFILISTTHQLKALHQTIKRKRLKMNEMAKYYITHNLLSFSSN